MKTVHEININLFIYRNCQYTYIIQEIFVKENCVGPVYPANYGALARLCRPQVQSDFGVVSFVSISDRARSNTTRSSACFP